MSRRALGILAMLVALPLLPLGPTPARADETERRMFRIAAPDQISLLELLNQLRPTMGGHYTFPDDLGAKNVRFTGGLEIPYRDGHLAEDVRAFYATLLQIQGYSMVDRGTIIEIVAAAEALHRPTHVYGQGEIDQLPATDTLVAVMYTFKNFDANQLGPRLQPLLINGVEQVVAVPQSRTIMLVAYASKLRELVRLLEAMDISSPDAQMRSFELLNAAADEILRPLEELMNARLQIGGGAPMPPGAPRPGRENATAPVLVADPRSNRAIYAIALPVDLDMIAELVTLLDREIQAPGSRIRFYPLQYRSVEARAGAAAAEGEQPESGLKDILEEMYAERAKVEEARADAAAPAGAPSSASSNRSSDVLVPRLVSDPDTNHLIVIYPSERYIPEVEDAIHRLDRRTPQVFLEAVILELGQDATRELGIEMASIDEEPSRSGQPPRFGGGTSFNLSRPTTADDGQGREPIFSTGSLTAFLFKDKFEHIPILMRLLRTDADSQVLAVPRIMTDANKKAVFDITQSEPVPVTTQGNATTQTATQFVEANTTLDVTPSVGIELVPTGRTDGEGNPILEQRYFVRMRLKQTIETFTQSFGGGATPAKNSRSAETNQITIPDGATVIFGGFTNKTRRTTQARVPFFGSIPLLGNLFRSKRDTDVYTTIFVFLTPHVISDGHDLATLEGRLRSFEELAQLRDRIAPLLPTPEGAQPPAGGDTRRTREGYTWPD